MNSHFVTMSDGIRLHYLEDGCGPALLLVPGFTATAEMWKPQIQYSAQHHRVVAIDPRSHGESDRPHDGHCPSRMARDIYDAIEALQLAPVVVVAWAFACSQMLQYVEQHGTEQLSGLVLVDGYVGRDRTFEQLMHYLHWAHDMQVDRERHTRSFVRSWFVQPHPDDYIDRLTRLSMKCPTNSLVAMVASWQLLKNQSPILATIDVPLMYMAIEEKRNQAEVVRRFAPAARVEFIEQAGHALFVDQPAEFNRLLEQFLTEGGTI